MIAPPLLERMLAEVLHDVIRANLKDRFGSDPYDLRKLLDAVTDKKRLMKINVLVAKCPTLEAFRKELISYTNRKRLRRA